MKKYILLLVFAAALCYVSSQVPQERNVEENFPTNSESMTQDLTVSGSGILLPLFEIWVKEYGSISPDFGVQLLPGRDGDGPMEQFQSGADLHMFTGTSLQLPDSANLWNIALASEAVVPIYNSGNPFAERLKNTGLSHTQLIELFSSGSIPSWGDLLGVESNEPVHVFILSPDLGASDVWSRFLFSNPEKLKGRVLLSDAEMVDAIASDPYALGFCNLKFAYDLSSGKPQQKIGVVPLDLNVNGRIDYIERIPEDLKSMQRVIWLGSYPHNLCRKLSLIASEKPTDPAVLEFLTWILTDGQYLLCQNGYCKLKSFDLEKQVDCLNTFPGK